MNLLDEKYESIIVNCDNNSPDKTNKIFCSVETKHQKKSIISFEKGKGRNLYNFFKYCLDENVVYGITIDADLKTFQKDWLFKMIMKLEEGNNFVCPLYERRKEEGNTTNHFICPVLYSVYGRFIRQPIGGDYAFDQIFIRKILQEEFTESILEYGIDIFMVVTAIVKNLSIAEVELGEKIHGISCHKMIDIFESVLKGFAETYKHYPVKLSHEPIKYIPRKIKNDKWNYYEFIEKKYSSTFKKLNYEQSDYRLIEQNWLEALKNYIYLLPNINEDMILKMQDLFICRCISFWNEIDKNNDCLWEQIIIDNCLEMRKI